MDEFFGVPEFFRDENLFITGGTGFMGKVLIEKLLRCCPDIGKIYILIRTKKNKTPEERWKEICEQPLFDRLKEEQPSALDKVVAINGDVTELELRLSQNDRKLLIETVGIVCHSAAAVTFNQPLKNAIIMNARGTREVCKLCLDMKRLKVFCHVSTAYAHIHSKVIEEIMYPPQVDWQKAIETAEGLDVSTLNAFTFLYAKGAKNTYIFTKAIAERIVFDLLNDKVPNIIIRPTVVVAAYKDPIPGWIDNFYGPISYTVASGLGLMRVNFGHPSIAVDYIPVDVAIKLMITAMWYKGIKSRNAKTEVFNCGTKGFFNVKLQHLMVAGRELLRKEPFIPCFWHVGVTITTNYVYYYFCVIFFHFLPALFLDAVLKATNKKPMIMKLQRGLFQVTNCIFFMLCDSWEVCNDKICSLQEMLLHKDIEAFGNACNTIDLNSYMFTALPGYKQYLLKIMPSEENRVKAKRLQIILYGLHLIVTMLKYYLLYYVVFVRFDLISKIYSFCGLE